MMAGISKLGGNLGSVKGMDGPQELVTKGPNLLKVQEEGGGCGDGVQGTRQLTSNPWIEVLYLHLAL